MTDEDLAKKFIESQFLIDNLKIEKHMTDAFLAGRASLRAELEDFEVRHADFAYMAGRTAGTYIKQIAELKADNERLNGEVAEYRQMLKDSGE